MTTVREVEERHERDSAEQDHRSVSWMVIHADRAFLLAEVRRLRALCGRAAHYCAGTTPDSMDFYTTAAEIAAELKEAASE